MSDNAAENLDSTSQTQSPKGGLDFVKQRALRVCFAPKQIWEEVKDESWTEAELFKNYIMPLAAVPVIAQYIGMVVFGIKIPFIEQTYRWGIFEGLVQSIVQYAMALVFVYLMAKLISFIATKLGSELSNISALKAVAFGASPAYLFGVLNIIPSLGFLGVIGGIYSFVCIYFGITRVGNVESGKAIGTEILSLIGTIICVAILSLVLSAVLPTPAGPELNLSDSKVKFGDSEIDIKGFQEQLQQRIGRQARFRILCAKARGSSTLLQGILLRSFRATKNLVGHWNFKTPPKASKPLRGVVGSRAFYSALSELRRIKLINISSIPPPKAP